MSYINLLDVFYPIGSLYFSTIDTSPASFIGGQWIKISDDTMIGAGNGYSGSHTITAEQMPSHAHANPVAITWGGDAGNYRSICTTNSPFWSKADWHNATDSTGGGKIILPTILEYISGTAQPKKRGDIV